MTCFEESGMRLRNIVSLALVAMLLTTALQWGFDFKGVATLGTAFGGIPMTLPHFRIPPFDFTTIVQLIGPAFTIALLGARASPMSWRPCLEDSRPPARLHAQPRTSVTARAAQSPAWCIAAFSCS